MSGSGSGSGSVSGSVGVWGEWGGGGEDLMRVSE